MVVGEVILVGYCCLAAVTGRYTKREWEKEFGKPKEFVDWFAGYFIAGITGIMSPIIAPVYTLYKLTHRKS